jgi:hypothetical protein
MLSVIVKRPGYGIKPKLIEGEGAKRAGQIIVGGEHA